MRERLTSKGSIQFDLILLTAKNVLMCKIKHFLETKSPSEHELSYYSRWLLQAIAERCHLLLQAVDLHQAKAVLLVRCYFAYTFTKVFSAMIFLLFTLLTRYLSFLLQSFK